MTLRGKTAIVGIGELKPMKSPPSGKTEWGIMAEAAQLAIEDAGLCKEDIDGIIVEPPITEMHFGPSMLMAEYLQIPIRYGGSAMLMGASAAGQVWRAAAAIDAGLCNTVLCVTGAIRDSAKFTKMVTTIPFFGPEAQYEDPYGPVGANSGYAQIAQRHAYKYGTTDEQRARVAVDQRTNACANPDALFYGQPITIDDVLKSKIVCSPLHLLEIVMPCSGAAAIVVTSVERAKSLRNPPVYLLGAGEHITHYSLTLAPTITTSPVKIAAEKAFQMAGVNVTDIDLVSAYDCYTITVIITLEDAGFCKKGEGGPFVWETDMTYKGNFPVNTNGGELSVGQPGLAGGMSHIIEVSRQLMKRAGERQVNNCEIAYVNGNGGYMSAECSLIFGSSATL
ncbi:thiolase family protein [Chloroflexota bacterium]